MRRALAFIRSSRAATIGVAVIIALLAFAPTALSRSGPAQSRLLFAQVIDVDDCKDGGWEDYNVFKNQGDCVSYVVTDGRNQPDGTTSTTTTLGPTTTTTTTTLVPTTTTTTTTLPGSMPADRDDCKNGGWEDYNVFKNQGDCVSWVATGGANPPDGA